jgi:hypothetical protein
LARAAIRSVNRGLAAKLELETAQRMTLDFFVAEACRGRTDRVAASVRSSAIINLRSRSSSLSGERAGRQEPSQSRSHCHAEQRNVTADRHSISHNVYYVQRSWAAGPSSAQPPQDAPRITAASIPSHPSHPAAAHLGCRQHPDSPQLILTAHAHHRQHAQSINQARATGRTLNSESHPSPQPCRIHRPAIQPP